MFSNLVSYFPVVLIVNSFTISWRSDFAVELAVNGFTISWRTVFPVELDVNGFYNQLEDGFASRTRCK
ncbi:hypothetical protein ACTQ5F_04740 [Jeotgalibaca porci]|uniref:hypothetical protein n=1 Tax=Jeotgalibaca porci TaxID=1868793 RepID=UPI003F8F588B